MSFCPQCGKEIKQDANFCVGCGKKIEAPTMQTAQTIQETTIPSKPSNNKTPLIIAVAVLGAIVLLLGGLFISKSLSEKADKNDVTDNTTTVTTTEAAVTADNTYTGIIRVEDATCYLDLGKEASVYLPDSDETLTADKIYLGQDDYKTFKDYNGMTVTLKGELFNYRGGGTLMFTDTPVITESSGTPEAVTKSATYQNWNSTDNATKFRDAGKVLETILANCDEVESYKVMFKSDVLEDINREGFGFFNSVMVSINGTWMNDCEFDVFITPTEEYVNIYFGTQNAPDIPCFTYTWSGEFISGLMPLDEYIIQEGLTR